MEILQVVAQSFVSIAVLFLLSRIEGKCSISQLTMFDYINSITIGSIAAELATELEQPWKPLIALIVYGAIAYGLSVLSNKVPRARKFINGTPTIILDNGKLYRRNMKKAKLDLSEFMVLCRQEGYFNLNDIQTAVFEYNGRLTVLPVSAKRPVNPTDLNLSPQPEHICTEVIMDGRILEGNLKRMGLDKTWLDKQLKNQGYSNAKEIFLGICDENHRLSLFEGA